MHKNTKKLLPVGLWLSLILTAPATMAEQFAHAAPPQLSTSAAELGLKSSSVVVYDPSTGEVLLERMPNVVRPIASLTKLMTAMVVIDANLPQDEVLTVTNHDVDRLRHSRSKLPVGTKLTRHEMLLLALAASENRAASALAHSYPGGASAFIKAMNNKASALGLKNTHFVDSTGLHDENVSTATDLVKLIIAAHSYSQIKEMSTNGTDHVVDKRLNRKIEFRNTNALVRDKEWDVNLSKTGYIISAGYCLVMHTIINDRPLAVILLNSQGKYSKFGDANRIKQWLMQVDNRTQVSKLTDS